MNQLPLTVCWHCDRPLDGASGFGDDEGQKPGAGAVSLCLYCGAVAVFGPDLALMPPSEALLDALQEDKEFLLKYCQFAWARQYVMIKHSLMREREDPDR